ncbi:hypothetical protein E3N88_28768 [Mikania micrantha]|uniref:Uncharacterized protein n=1 Tax=Mikania micrantha TaxID=192012 RepID=A0A5N6N1J2_9ASTR|nr:hypothetical protein E3N88_28768 [Mikania micrantha]
MKNIPLRKICQDFSDSFRWWYYDRRTAEAVIVLCKESAWDTIRIFDPMWLTNLSLEDVKTLYRCQIFFDVGDMEQALHPAMLCGFEPPLLVQPRFSPRGVRFQSKR